MYGMFWGSVNYLLLLSDQPLACPLESDLI